MTKIDHQTAESRSDVVSLDATNYENTEKDDFEVAWSKLYDTYDISPRPSSVKDDTRPAALLTDHRQWTAPSVLENIESKTFEDDDNEDDDMLVVKAVSRDSVTERKRKVEEAEATSSSDSDNSEEAAGYGVHPKALRRIPSFGVPRETSTEAPHRRRLRRSTFADQILSTFESVVDEVMSPHRSRPCRAHPMLRRFRMEPFPANPIF